MLVKKTKVKKKVAKKVTTSELVIKPKTEWVKNSLANKKQYQEKYSKSIKSNDEFWKKEGKRITWIKPYKEIKNIKTESKFCTFLVLFSCNAVSRFADLPASLYYPLYQQLKLCNLIINELLQ